MRAHRIRSVCDDEQGVAMTEFALVLPLLLLLGLAGIETSNYVIAHLRVSQIAMTTSDNAARVRDAIDEHDVNELFIGAKLVGQSIQFGENGRVILSSLEPQSSTTTDQWIRWQRCYGLKNAPSSYGVPRTTGGAAITDGSEASKTSPSNPAKSLPRNGLADTAAGMGPPANQIAAMGGTAVMFVEVVYDYQPIVWGQVIGNRTIRYSSAFNVRQRADQVMKDGGLASSKWSTCNRFYS